MDDGCIFEPGYNSTKCQKYNISCVGNEKAKRKCPEWGQTIAFEKYLKQKLEFETNIEDNSYSSFLRF